MMMTKVVRSFWKALSLTTLCPPLWITKRAPGPGLTAALNSSLASLSKYCQAVQALTIKASTSSALINMLKFLNVFTFLSSVTKDTIYFKSFFYNYMYKTPYYTKCFFSVTKNTIFIKNISVTKIFRSFVVSKVMIFWHALLYDAVQVQRSVYWISPAAEECEQRRGRLENCTGSTSSANWCLDQTSRFVPTW